MKRITKDDLTELIIQVNVALNISTGNGYFMHYAKGGVSMCCYTDRSPTRHTGESLAYFWAAPINATKTRMFSFLWTYLRGIEAGKRVALTHTPVSS